MGLEPRPPVPNPFDWVRRFLMFEVLVAPWAMRILFLIFLATGLLAIIEGNPYRGNPYSFAPSLFLMVLQTVATPPLSVIIGLLMLRVAMEAIFVLFRISEQIGALGNSAPAASAPPPQPVPSAPVTAPTSAPPLQIQQLGGRLIVVLVLIGASLLLLFLSGGVVGPGQGRLIDVGFLGLVALILFATGVTMVMLSGSAPERRAKIPGGVFGLLALSLGLSVITLLQRLGMPAAGEWGLPWYGFIVALSVAAYLAFQEWFEQRTAPPPVSGTDSTDSSSSDPQ